MGLLYSPEKYSVKLVGSWPWAALRTLEIYSWRGWFVWFLIGGRLLLVFYCFLGFQRDCLFLNVLKLFLSLFYG